MVERRLWARVDDREDVLGENGFRHSGWRPAYALAEEFALVMVTDDMIVVCAA